MGKPTTFLPALFLGVAGTISVAAPSLAVPITYTEQATATGSLGGVSFTNASVLLTMTSDTTNVTGSGPIFDNLATLNLSITGFAPATFTDITEGAANQTVAIAGFSDVTNGSAILATRNAAFSTYNLKTSIGPLSGTSIFNPSMPSFATTDGVLVLFSVAGSTIFTATTSAAVPEPASLTLLGAGLVGFGLIRLRRKS